MKAEGWAKLAIIYDVCTETNVRKKNFNVIAKVQVLDLCIDESLHLIFHVMICDLTSQVMAQVCAALDPVEL